MAPFDSQSQPDILVFRSFDDDSRASRHASLGLGEQRI